MCIIMENSVLTINYMGKQGFGSASIIFLNGQIFGTDVIGSEYTGTYKEDNGKITGEVQLNVPAGATLVTGAPVSADPYTILIPFSMPAGIKEKQVTQIQVTLPSGPVNANIKKVKDLTACIQAIAA